MFLFCKHSHKLTILTEHVDIKEGHLFIFFGLKRKTDVFMFAIHIVNKSFNMFRYFEQNKNVNNKNIYSQELFLF